MRHWGLVVLGACGYHPPAAADPADAPMADSPGDTSLDGRVIQPDSPLPASDVIIEAEAFTANVAGTSRTWTVATATPGFSGASYMLCGPGTGAFCANDASLDTCAASLDYALAIPANGTYFVHVRTLSTSSADDSVWYGIDDVPAANEISPASDNVWLWETGTTTYSLTAGAHKLTIWQRECGSKVDVVAVTDSATPPP